MTRKSYIRTTSLFVALGLMTTGCGRWNINKKVAREFYSAPILVNTNDAPLTFSMASIAARIQEVKSLTNNVQRQKTMRDDLIGEMMRYSDYNYADFKTRAFTQNAAMNTGLDMASLGLSAAATIVAGPAGQAMSATDTGLKGVQSKISERFLLNQTMILLITTMDSRRAETRAGLFDGMRKEYSAFQIEEAVTLASEYHNRGNLVDAMAYLQTTMGSQRATNEVEAVRAQKAK